jgi:type I restriction enzyme, R subunit
LTEEELVIFDLLTKPDPVLKKTEELQVKKVAHELLEKLKHEKLVLDWRKRQQSRAAVKTAIEDVLDRLPKGPYPSIRWREREPILSMRLFDGTLLAI